MPLLTPPTPQTPAQLARAQIEQALASSLAFTLALRKQTVGMLTSNVSGATLAQIIAEFGPDWALFVDHFQKEQAAILVVDPTQQAYFDQEAQDVAAALAKG